MTGLQFAAAIVNALAWPAAVMAALWLLRRELPHALRRLQDLATTLRTAFMSSPMKMPAVAND